MFGELPNSMSCVLGSSLFNCSLLMANKTEPEGLVNGRARLLLNCGRAQSGRAKEAGLSKWVDWGFCRDLQILVESQANFNSESEGAKTAFGCANQGPSWSRCVSQCAVFHSGGTAPRVVLVFRKKYGGDSEKTTLSWLRIGKHSLFWETQVLHLCDTAKGRLKDGMILMSYGCTDSRTFPKSFTCWTKF